MRAWFSIGVGILLYANGAAAQTNVEFDLANDAILPGTATSLSVRIVNDGPVAISVPTYVVMQVRNEVGEEFIATVPGESALAAAARIPEIYLPDTEEDEPPVKFEVSARSSFEFAVPLTDAVFFDDRRMQKPGEYRIRLGITEYARTNFLWSGERTLRVSAPLGENRKVWDRMMELSEGEGWGRGDWAGSPLVEEVWEKYRESDYTAYLCGLSYRHENDWAARREYGLRGPRRGYILLEEAVDLASSWRLVLRDGGSVGDANRVLDQAKQLLKDLSTADRDPHVRFSAARAIESFPTASDVAKAHRDIHAPRPAQPERKIEPHVDCVAPGIGGEFVAWFGYTSSFEYQYRLSSKTGENKLEPKPHERGQPVDFVPGRHERVFSVSFNGDPITWFIRGEKATASRETNGPCQ